MDYDFQRSSNTPTFNGLQFMCFTRICGLASNITLCYDTLLPLSASHVVLRLAQEDHYDMLHKTGPPLRTA